MHTYAVVLGIAAVVIYAMIAWMGTGDLVGLIRGDDERLSSSKFQNFLSKSGSGQRVSGLGEQMMKFSRGRRRDEG